MPMKGNVREDKHLELMSRDALITGKTCLSLIENLNLEKTHFYRILEEIDSACEISIIF